MLLVVSLVSGASAAHAAGAADRQLDHGSALYQVQGPDHAAAQEFRTESARLDTVSVFLVSRSTVGRITVSVRSTLDDPGS
ncbi:MAG: hypothetical protein WCA46_25675, partial [Actinocatenispora sp.]